jgi:amidophosphoribosyltransferase
MCGIVGIVGTSAVNQRIYDALTVLQHRGQDAAGIMTSSDGELCVRKGSGLVRDVFQQHHMLELKGNVGIGHVRYPTAGFDALRKRSPSTSTPRTACAWGTTAISRTRANLPRC